MQDKSFIERNYHVFGYTFGSVIAEIVTLPIYTTRTQYLTTKNISVKQTILHIYKNYGIIGFYNAIFSAVFARIMSSSLKFLIYNELKYCRGNTEQQILNNMINGCIAGISASFIVHPIDTFTNYLQRQKQINRTMLCRKILYAGFQKTIIRNLVLYSILFPVFDYMKYLTYNNIGLSCITTSLISTLILQPVDFLRTRHMAQQYNNPSFRSCYKGFYITYLANSLHFTISMSIANLFISNKY
jgi:hypothetical protein